MKGKRILGLIVVFIGLMMCSQKVKADIIYEPNDNFYKRHAKDTQRVDRTYTANGPDGTVIAYKDPLTNSAVATLKNGTEMYISYSYKDSNGIEWGIYENIKERKNGWIPMEYLQVVYDYISFKEEYADQIEESRGQIDESYIEKEINFWNYPGSESSRKVTLYEYTPEYSSVFIDELGRTWVNVSYYMGIRHGWLCLDELTADYEVLYKEGSPERGSNQPITNYTSTTIKPGGSGNVVIIMILLVSVVVLLTAALLFWIKKSKREL